MPISFSQEIKDKIVQIRKHYPVTQAACMPVLHLVQKEYGALSDEVISAVANELNLPEAHVHGVVTFYTMYHKKPLGKNILMMCTNVSCLLRGGKKTLAVLEEKLGISAGQTTADEEFTLIEEECLAACASAPAMICGEKYFLNFTEDKVDEVLAECRKNSPAKEKNIKRE